MAYAPVLTPQPTGGRVPRVDVKFNAFAATTSYINVYRIVAGRTLPVSGGLNVGALAGVVVPDEQAAFCAVSYRAEMFSAAGVSLGFTDSTSTTLAVTDVWIQNAMDASLSVNLGKYGLEAGSADSLARPFASSIVYPENASVGRLVSGRRQGLRGAQFNLATTTIEQADKLEAIFGTYEVQQLPVACIRTPGPMRIPRVLFLHAPDGPVETVNDLSLGGTYIAWTLQGDEVAPPSPGLAVPLLTYTDLDVSYATYTARDAAYASYSAQDSDYTLAGAAGGL